MININSFPFFKIFYMCFCLKYKILYKIWLFSKIMKKSFISKRKVLFLNQTNQNLLMLTVYSTFITEIIQKSHLHMSVYQSYYNAICKTGVLKFTQKVDFRSLHFFNISFLNVSVQILSVNTP